MPLAFGMLPMLPPFAARLEELVRILGPVPCGVRTPALGDVDKTGEGVDGAGCAFLNLSFARASSSSSISASAASRSTRNGGATSPILSVSSGKSGLGTRARLVVRMRDLSTGIWLGDPVAPLAPSGPRRYDSVIDMSGSGGASSSFRSSVSKAGADSARGRVGIRDLGWLPPSAAETLLFA